MLAIIMLAGKASADTPRFDAYGVHVQRGSIKGRIQVVEPASRRYTEMLQSAVGKPVNFAGHFVLTIWGCGASCIMGAAIDAKNGAISWLPFTVCCWSREIMQPLEYRPDSRLLLVHGSRNEKGSGTHAYLFDGHAFALLPPAKPSAAP